MIESLGSGWPAQPMRPAAEAPAQTERSETARRFEQLLWADMLSHAGLEKAFTQNGGEGASAFARYIVEAIAKDLAEKHSLGLGDRIDEIAARQAEANRTPAEGG